MGYIENRLPVALANLGHDVHVIASDGQVYYTSPRYQDIYERFLGPRFVATEVSRKEGFSLYRLPHFSFKHLLGMKGLAKRLSAIEPDVVQVMDHVSFSALQSAFWCTRTRTPLFTSSHMHLSAFGRVRPGLLGRGTLWVSSWLPGRMVSKATAKSYTISNDAAELAERFLGVEREKVAITPLGVDTRIFRPPETLDDLEARDRLRSRLGFVDEEIVCIYSGRFTQEKDPRLLAQAIEQLRTKRLPFRGLFVGEGPQQGLISRIDGNVTVPFVGFHEIADYYRAADIGVWPRQESTSMLDAGASGLPLVVSDRVQVRERIAEGGLTYVEGDPDDLAARLNGLLNPELRRMLGSQGARAIRETLSWERLAELRVGEYVAALRGTA